MIPRKTTTRKLGFRQSMSWLVIVILLLGSFGAVGPSAAIAAEPGATSDPRAELEARVAEGLSLNQGDNPGEVWLAFQGALLAAQNALLCQDDDDIAKALNILNLVYGQLQPPKPGAEEPRLQTAALAEKIAEAEGLLEGDYAGGWEALAGALAGSQAVLMKEAATQAEVDQALAGLVNAINALERINGDPAALTAAVLLEKLNAAAALPEEDYTEESWLALTGAINAAQTTLAKEIPSQTELEQALLDLTGAMESLELKPAGLMKPMLLTGGTKGDLEAKIAENRALNRLDYTLASWSALERALVAAEAVLADSGAGDEAIQQALTDLSAAQAALISHSAGYIYQIAGTGSSGSSLHNGSDPLSAKIRANGGIAVDPVGNIYIGDQLYIHALPAKSGTYFGVSMKAGQLYTIVGGGTTALKDDGSNGAQARDLNLGAPAGGILLDQAGNLYFSAGLFIFKVDPRGKAFKVVGGARDTKEPTSPDGTPALEMQSSSDSSFKSFALDSQGNLYLIINRQLMMVPAQTGRYYEKQMNAGRLYRIAGDESQSGGGYIRDGGPAAQALFSSAAKIAVDNEDNLYALDRKVYMMPKADGTYYGIEMKQGSICAIAGGYKGYAGDYGPAKAAGLNSPAGVAFDSAGNMYIADQSNNAVRKVTPSGEISTAAGGAGTAGTPPSAAGTPATDCNLLSPASLVVVDQLGKDKAQTVLYIAGSNQVTYVYQPASAAFPVLNGLSLTSNLTASYSSTDVVIDLNAARAGGRLQVAATDQWGQKFDLTTTTAPAISWQVVSGPASLSGKDLTVKGVGKVAVKASAPRGVYSNAVEINVTKETPVLISLRIGGEPHLVYKAPQTLYDLNQLTISGKDQSGDDFSLEGLTKTWSVIVGEDKATVSADGILTITGEGVVGVSLGIGGIKSNVLLVTKEQVGIIDSIAMNGMSGYPVDGANAVLSPGNLPNEVKLDKYGYLYITFINGDDGSIWMVPARDSAEGRYGISDLKAGHIYRIAGLIGWGLGSRGDGGLARDARLSEPVSLAFDSRDNLYVADNQGYGVRRIDAGTGIITTVFGQSDGSRGPNRYFEKAPGLISNVGLTGEDCFECHLASKTPIDQFAGSGGPATEALTYDVDGVAIDKEDNIFITEHYYNWVRVIPARDYADFYGLKDVKAGYVYRIAGDGGQYSDVAFDHDAKQPIVPSYQGDGGSARNTIFTYSYAVSFDSKGNMYVGDTPRNRIRMIDRQGIIKTLNPSNDQYLSDDDGKPLSETHIMGPQRIVVDAWDNLYFSETANISGTVLMRIRMVPAKSGVYHGIAMQAGHVYTVAGQRGQLGVAGDRGPATAAQLGYIPKIDVGQEGNLYMADRDALKIRMVGTPPFLADLKLKLSAGAPSRTMTYRTKLTYDLGKYVTLEGKDQNGAVFDISDRPVTWKVVSGPAAINDQGSVAITGTGTISVAASVYGEGGLLSNPLNFTVDPRDSDDDGPGTSAPEPSIPALAPLVTPDGLVPGGDNTEYNKGLLDSLRNATEEERSRAQLPPGAPDLTNSAGATLVANDGLRVVIPQGAIAAASGTVRLNIGLGNITEPPRGNSSAVVLDPLKYQRQFELEGQAGASVSFNAPVTLSFPVTAADLPAGITTGQLAVYWWNPDKNDWAKLGGVYDGAGGSLSITTYHFSTYAVMADTGSVPGRLAGRDLYDTANAVAEQGWKLGADNIILVNAQAHADALAAIPLAYKLNAPILFTGAQELPASTAEQIKKLAPQNIVLIGGTAVISQALENSLGQTYGKESIIRYSGADRYDTAAMIAKALGATGGAVIANGEEGHYADALTISSYAAYNGIPILFTQQSGLPDITVRTMNDLKVEKTVVVGGDSVVPVSVYQQFPGAVRYGGSDRYETAAMIAQELKLNLNTVYVATGKGFADALVAGNLASHTLSPLILVDHGVPDAAAGFFSANRDSIHNLVMVGGEGIINQVQEGQIRKTVEK